MPNQKLLEYFAKYVQHFSLEQYIRFNHEVKSIIRSTSYQNTGKWTVTYYNQ